MTWFKSSPEDKALDRIDGDLMEFEWNIFPGFTRLQLSNKVQEYTVKIERNTREIYWTGHLHVDVQRLLMVISGQQERMRVKCSTRFSMQRDSEQVPGSEKKRYSVGVDSPQGERDRIAEQMMLTFAESGHPVVRATSPLCRGVLKSKGGRNCRYTMAPTLTRLKLFFAHFFL